MFFHPRALSSYLQRDDVDGKARLLFSRFKHRISMDIQSCSKFTLVRVAQNLDAIRMYCMLLTKRYYSDVSALHVFVFPVNAMTTYRTSRNVPGTLLLDWLFRKLCVDNSLSACLLKN
jgi:hypothetical protein